MTPKTRDAYILAAFSRIWQWDDARKECKKQATCAKCKKVIEIRFILRKSKKVKKLASQVDHIEPKCPIEGYRIINGHLDWNQVHDRMFVPLGGLQLLCTECHEIKSAEENAKRRKARE